MHAREASIEVRLLSETPTLSMGNQKANGHQGACRFFFWVLMVDKEEEGGG